MAKSDNVKAKGVEINLGDKKFLLKYDVNAMIELEDAFGSLQDAMDAMKSMQMKGFRKLLWAGLIHSDEELTEKYVGSLIDFKDFQYIAEKMTEAFSSSLPKVSDKEKENMDNELKNVEKVSE